MIRHHPSGTTLLACAAGTLPPLHGAVLSVHLSVCAACRDALRGMEEIGGALLASLESEHMAVGALARAMAQLDKPYDANASTAPRAISPQRSLVEQLATGHWIWLGPGIRLMPLQRRDASGTRLDLIRVAPGVALPAHGHTGVETTCILQGSFSDSTGEFGAHDFAEGDALLTHAPIAGPGAECICLIATSGRLRAHSWLARLLQPLVGV